MNRINKNEPNEIVHREYTHNEFLKMLYNDIISLNDGGEIMFDSSFLNNGLLLEIKLQIDKYNFRKNNRLLFKKIIDIY